MGFGPPAALEGNNFSLEPYRDVNSYPLVPAQFLPRDRQNMLPVWVPFLEEEALPENQVGGVFD